MLIIIIVLLFAISIWFAIVADKKRDLFQFDLLLNEKIIQVENDVTFFGTNRQFGKLGLLYLTDKRLIFFKYKYGLLQFIPIIGNTLVSVFIDKRIVCELAVNNIITYHFKPSLIKSNNGRVISTSGVTSLFTFNKQNISFDIPLKYTDYTKSDLLVSLDKLLLLKN